MNLWWVSILERHRELSDRLNDPELPLDEMIQVQKALASIAESAAVAEKAEVAEFLRESEESEDEQRRYEVELESLKSQFDELLKRKSQEESKIILEIRPGTGGQEAALFASLLFEMYRVYAEENGWMWDVLMLDFNDIGGITSACVSIEGKDAFYLMEHESGVHRVQRIPKTESCGRIHTSTATVAVLMEPEESNVEIDQKYLRVDVFRAGGAGGQHVNKTESAIRLTYSHPDFEKIVISMQDEKSQHKNKSKAMKILRAKIADATEARVNKEASEKRRMQVGKGDRSEKIRTYNFPQDRITDHRSGISMYCIDESSLMGAKHLQAMTEPIRSGEK